MSGPFLLYLAPIQGITDHLFRTLYARHFPGFDLAVAPFVTGKGKDRIRNNLLKDLLPERNRELAVIPQVLSADAGEFLLLVRALEELGYDRINWNLGCPYPMAVKKGRGAGLLPHPDRVNAFLEGVSGRMKSRLSVKMRLGLDSPEEIHRLLPVLDRYPLEEIIIHPRTARQMYGGKADPAAFGECLGLTGHKVAYNGDVLCADDLRSLASRFPGVDRWMIGRGAVIDPLFLEEIRTGRIAGDEERRKRLKDFHGALLEGYGSLFSGSAHLLDRMKGLWEYLSLGFREGRKIGKMIRKTGNLRHYSELTERILTEEAFIHPGGDRAAP